MENHPPLEVEGPDDPAHDGREHLRMMNDLAVLLALPPRCHNVLGDDEVEPARARQFSCGQHSTHGAWTPTGSLAADL